MSSQTPEIHTEEIALFSRPPVNVAEDRISWHEVRPSYMSNVTIWVRMTLSAK